MSTKPTSLTYLASGALRTSRRNVICLLLEILAVFAERRPSGSSLQASGDRGLDVFPGNDVGGVGFMVRETTVELCALDVSQRHGSAFSGNAVPKIFDQCQTLLDTEPVNT